MSSLSNSKSFVDAKTEYTKQLQILLTPRIYEGIESIYTDSNNNVSEGGDKMRVFQNFLKTIPKWNQEIINHETIRIKDDSKCNYLEKLLNAIFVSHTKILTLNSNLDIQVPKLNHFIHKCYIETARELYKNPYLLDKTIRNPREKQNNLRETLSIINDSINTTICRLLPLENILDVYLKETSLDEEDEQSVVDEVISNEVQIGGENTPSVTFSEPVVSEPVVASVPKPVNVSSSEVENNSGSETVNNAVPEPVNVSSSEVENNSGSETVNNAVPEPVNASENKEVVSTENEEVGSSENGEEGLSENGEEGLSENGEEGLSENEEQQGGADENRDIILSEEVPSENGEEEEEKKNIYLEELNEQQGGEDSDVDMGNDYEDSDDERDVMEDETEDEDEEEDDEIAKLQEQIKLLKEKKNEPKGILKKKVNTNMDYLMNKDKLKKDAYVFVE